MNYIFLTSTVLNLLYNFKREILPKRKKNGKWTVREKCGIYPQWSFVKQQKRMKLWQTYDMKVTRGEQKEGDFGVENGGGICKRRVWI